MRGYIAMLATRKDYRGHGIATSLVKMAIEKMISEDADEVRIIRDSLAAEPPCSQSTATRSLSRLKSTTSHHYVSTRIWGSFARSGCIDTISTATRLSA